MISQGTGLLISQIILVLILIVSRVSQPTGRQLVFIISQGLPPLAAGDRLKRRDRGSEWQPPVWALSWQSVRQHFLAPLPGIEFFWPWHFNDIHLLIFSSLIWAGSFNILASFHHISASSLRFCFLFGWRLHFIIFPRQEASLISACWLLFGS